MDRRPHGREPCGVRQADFFNIVCWRALAENCGKYLKKGSKVCATGPIQNRSYEANDGTKRYVTEIVAEEVEFLDRPGQNNIQSFQSALIARGSP